MRRAPSRRAPSNWQVSPDPPAQSVLRHLDYDNANIPKGVLTANNRLAARLNPFEPGGVEAVEAGKVRIGIGPLAGEAAHLAGRRNQIIQPAEFVS